MSKTYRVATTLQPTSGIPDDRCIFDVSFLGPDSPSGADLTVLVDAVYDFLTVPRTTYPSDALFGYLSKAVAQNGHQVAIYEQSTAGPHLPVATASFNLPSAPTSTAMPSEAALCCSFRAALVPGNSFGPGPRPMARRRGRFYFGPLGTVALDTSDYAGRPKLQLMTMLAEAAAESFFQPSGAWEWVVWSTADVQAHVIEHVWVDNAFDTQRRRGPASTTRFDVAL